MRDRLETKVFSFLQKHLDLNRPVLLGFSGGPDSLALLHLLLEYGKNVHLQLGLAHVDHGWREESAAEAKQLAVLAQNLSIPFHLKTLEVSSLKGNLEAACRFERLAFFDELSKKYDYQAVLLGHHDNDQAETVLKKILEGSSLASLKALLPINHVQDIALWRPMLGSSKKEIADWLQSRSLKGFQDRTNSDPRFLRGNMRVQILPDLNRHFGKQVTSSLCRIAKEASELNDYLETTLQTYLSQIKEGHLGLFLDLSKLTPRSLFEAKYIVRYCCSKRGFSLSYSQVEMAAEFLLAGSANRWLIAGKNRVYLDRKRLFILSPENPFYPEQRHPLNPGSFSFGNWNVDVRVMDEPVPLQASSWKEIWKGQLQVILPQGFYSLGTPELRASYRGHSSLDKWWTNHKIPAFLRQIVPVIWEKNSVKHEFLTGKYHKDQTFSQNCVRLTLSLDEKVHI